MQKVTIVFPKEWAVSYSYRMAVMSDELADLIESESDKLDGIELIGIFEGTQDEDLHANLPGVIVADGECDVAVIGRPLVQFLKPGQEVQDRSSQFNEIARRIARAYKRTL